MKILAKILLLFAVISCTHKTKFTVLDPLGVPSGEKRFYRVKQINGTFTNVVMLDTTYKAGDVVRLKIREGK